MTIDPWLADLETRHLADLRFAEVTRALRALSSGYVERRESLAARAAFASAGKRAAYAMYYGPLHFLTVQHIAAALPLQSDVTNLLDCGCGTGAASAAWVATVAKAPHVTAVDRDAWAITEARHTYRAFHIDADLRRVDLARLTIPRSADAIVAGWVMNEIDAALRDTLLARFLEYAAKGCQVLVIEPIATRISPWWPQWADRFTQAGGRADEWKFRVVLPDLIRRLDKAAGLRHDMLSARTLYAGS
jgi:ubiquinone/menaquinone biosynthesis C-methylase UbiE